MKRSERLTIAALEVQRQLDAYDATTGYLVADDRKRHRIKREGIACVLASIRAELMIETTREAMEAADGQNAK